MITKIYLMITFDTEVDALGNLFYNDEPHRDDFSLRSTYVEVLLIL